MTQYPITHLCREKVEKIIRPTSAQVGLLIIKTCWVVQVKIFLSNMNR